MKSWQILYTKSNIYAWIYSVHDRIYVDERSYPKSFSSHCFFIFDSTIRCTVRGCLSTGSNMIKKVINCAELGCHSFRSYSYIPRSTIMRDEVFVYLEIYLVYLEIYDYGEGVRFPDGVRLEHPRLACPQRSPGSDAGPSPGHRDRQCCSLKRGELRKRGREPLGCSTTICHSVPPLMSESESHASCRRRRPRTRHIYLDIFRYF